jgi:copper(I)-binding protein
MRRIGIAVLLLLGSVMTAHAGQPPVSVSDARVRWLPGDLPMAGYFVIISYASAPMRLVGAASPAFGDIMLHRSVDEEGVASMAHVDKVELYPGQAIAFAPGGYHLMLMNRTQELRAGEEVPVTLRFDDGQTLTVRFRVVGAQGE